MPKAGEERGWTSAVPLRSGPHLPSPADGRFQPALIPAESCCAHIVSWPDGVLFPTVHQWGHVCVPGRVGRHSRPHRAQAML